MRTHLSIALSEHDHPVVEKEEFDDDGGEIDQPYVTIKLSETESMSGPAEVVFGWIDELHARSLLVR